MCKSILKNFSLLLALTSIFPFGSWLCDCWSILSSHQGRAAFPAPQLAHRFQIIEVISEV